MFNHLCGTERIFPLRDLIGKTGSLKILGKQEVLKTTAVA